MWKFFKKEKLALFIVAFLYFVSSASRALIFLFIGIITNLLINPFDYTDLIINSSILLVLIFLHIVVGSLAMDQKHKLIQKLTIKLRDETINTIKSFSIRKINRDSIGKYLSWLKYDVEQIEHGVIHSFINLFNFGSSFIFYVAALFWISWEITLVVIALNCLVYSMPILFKNVFQKINTEWSYNNENLSSKLLKNLEAFNLFYFTNKQEMFLSFFNKEITEYNNKFLRLWKRNVYFEFPIYSLSSLIALIGTVVVSVILINAKIIPVGMILTISAIQGNMMQTFYGFIGSLISINSRKTILKKLLRKDFRRNLKYFDAQVNEFQLFSIQKLNYSYQNKQIFHNFNLKIIKNKKYAIIGKSGVGKTTLLYLLLGIYKDYYGSIKLNGYELKYLNENTIHNLISFIDNKNFLFNDSIKNNITLWEDSSKSTLIAKQKAKINEIDDTYFIKEEKSSLSEGQKQRINLARAFFEEKKVLILDEATANLDKENAILIEKSLLLDPSLTLIMVTHHLKNELVNLYDEIIYL